MEKNEILKQAYTKVKEYSQLISSFYPTRQTPITPESISKMIYQVKIDESNIEPIHNIIHKEQYTGKDIGIITLYEKYRQMEKYKKDNTNPEEINYEKANKEYERIKAEKPHFISVVGYESINQWLAKNYNYEMANIQQRTSKYNYIMSKAREIQLTENTLLFLIDEEIKNKLMGRFDIYKKKFETLSLEKYISKDRTPETQEKLIEQHIRNIKDGEENTLKSYYYLQCWNIAINLIAEFYNIPFIYILKYGYIKAIEKEYDEYNQLLKEIEKDIKELNLNSNIREKKIKIFKDIFKPLKYEQYKVNPELIEKAREQFNYNNFDSFVYSNTDIMEILTNNR